MAFSDSPRVDAYGFGSVTQLVVTSYSRNLETALTHAILTGRALANIWKHGGNYSGVLLSSIYGCSHIKLGFKYKSLQSLYSQLQWKSPKNLDNSNLICSIFMEKKVIKLRTANATMAQQLCSLFQLTWGQPPLDPFRMIRNSIYLQSLIFSN